MSQKECLGLGRNERFQPRRRIENASSSQLIDWIRESSEGVVIPDGPVVVTTGEHTGRSPKDKFAVSDPASSKYLDQKKTVYLPRQKAELLRTDLLEYMKTQDLFTVDAFAGADPKYQLSVRFHNTRAYPALFENNLFITPTSSELRNFKPTWNVL